MCIKIKRIQEYVVYEIFFYYLFYIKSQCTYVVQEMLVLKNIIIQKRFQTKLIREHNFCFNEYRIKNEIQISI